jgi:hypothetical protein
MTRTRILGLSLIAVLAMSALVAASASAQAPEFGRCVKVAKGTGKFGMASCTGEKAGSYEWVPGLGASSKFTTASKVGTFVTLTETVGGTKITCHGQTATGEYTGAKTVGQVLLRFTGCESSGGKANSPGEPEGVVVSKSLQGSLGIVKSGETSKQNKVGLDLLPEAPAGPVTEFSVGGIALVVRGSVIVPVTANKMQLTATLKFAQAKGKQKPERFQGEAKDVLEESVNGSAFEQAGLAFESTQTNEEAIEINSVV